MQLRILSPQEVISLSTPHGALGTLQAPSPILSTLLVSTPHGALGTLGTILGVEVPTRLSTQHGALGTFSLSMLQPLPAEGFKLHTVH